MPDEFRFLKDTLGRTYVHERGNTVGNSAGGKSDLSRSESDVNDDASTIAESVSTTVDSNMGSPSLEHTPPKRLTSQKSDVKKVSQGESISDQLRNALGGEERGRYADWTYEMCEQQAAVEEKIHKENVRVLSEMRIFDHFSTNFAQKSKISDQI